ncbi:MAG: class I SAM-dependent methyltransferase [Bacteroidetes bacterium]|nr:class I SAM-dependent methyltransferase [Bacteroidota bacterium]
MSAESKLHSDKAKYPMTWEETIIHLRTLPSFQEVLHESYLDSDLVSNAERFQNSDEFNATLKLIRSHAPAATTILDIGSGNGVSTIALARNGYTLTALEPDPSPTVGCAAIRSMAEHYGLKTVSILQSYAEAIPAENNTFDIVHVRQAMHHAQNLDKFLTEIQRVLKPGGFLFTLRDHVIYNNHDKQIFLKAHPLQEYYGGENAYTEAEYLHAMKHAGLKAIRVLRHFDSVINYAPLTQETLASLPRQFTQNLNTRAKQKFGILGNLPAFQYIYRKAVQFRFGGPLDERRIPGRMYSFVAVKPVSA